MKRTLSQASQSSPSSQTTLSSFFKPKASPAKPAEKEKDTNKPKESEKGKGKEKEKEKAAAAEVEVRFPPFFHQCPSLPHLFCGARAPRTQS